jgi:hypothetical protein
VPAARIYRGETISPLTSCPPTSRVPEPRRVPWLSLVRAPAAGTAAPAQRQKRCSVSNNLCNALLLLSRERSRLFFLYGVGPAAGTAVALPDHQPPHSQRLKRPRVVSNPRPVTVPGGDRPRSRAASASPPPGGATAGGSSGPDPPHRDDRPPGSFPLAPGAGAHRPGPEAQVEVQAMFARAAEAVAPAAPAGHVAVDG